MYNEVAVLIFINKTVPKDSSHNKVNISMILMFRYFGPMVSLFCCYDASKSSVTSSNQCTIDERIVHKEE